MSQEPGTPTTSQPVAPLSWNEVWIKALTRPSVATFEGFVRDPNATSERAYKWIVVTSLISYALYALVVLLATTFIGTALLEDFPASSMLGSSFLILICGAPFVAAFALIGFVISAGITQWTAGVLGGTGTYSELAYALAAFYAPLMPIAVLLGLIPYVALLQYPIWVYEVVLSVIAVRAVNKFGWGKAIASMLPVLAIILGLGLLLIYMQGISTQPPQTFQGDDFTLTHPGGWQTLDISQQDFCRQPAVECPFAISHPSGDGTNINLVHFALEQEITVEEADEVLWAELESSAPDVVLESREAIEIGGQSAIKRVFSMPSEALGARGHILQIYIVKELALFQFTAFAPSVEAFKEHQAEIEEIVTSIQFTATP